MIMDDMSQTRAAAIRTLRDSAEYGVAMFPDDGADATDAGEQIIMERARARRKELEEEERLEEKMLRDFEEEEAVRREANACPKPKKTAEMVWLNYFNECLFEKGLIDETMRNKLKIKISTTAKKR